MRFFTCFLVLLAALAVVSTAHSWAADERPMLKKLLAGPMKDVEEVVFAVRVPGRDHWYVNFGNYASDAPEPKDRARKFEDDVYWGYGEGGRLDKLNLRTGKVTTLLNDPKGGVRDPQVHYDAKKILFSYRKGGTHPFHLYEINVDGTGLKQLTFGQDDDIEPTYAPDGSIIFCSSRCDRFVNCWHSRVAVLYKCDADGKNIRPLSSNNDHDNTPWLLPDGRVAYMRWEYVDRSQVHYHRLWTANPDGTNQTILYGNFHPGNVYIDAKPIPGSEKIIMSNSPGHGRFEHQGRIAILDPKKGPDNKDSLRDLTKQNNWMDPWAFSERVFLASSSRGLCLFEVPPEGGIAKEEIIYRLPESEREKFWICEPRPIIKRQREKILPTRTNLDNPSGYVFLEDAHLGRNMEGIKPGEVKKLLVLKQLPKPVNYSGGMEPLTIGGSFTLAEIVGEVPVREDGSAFMELPALQSLFFIALNAKDQPIKRMHSFLTLQPGEVIGCVGCHEQRVSSPVARTGLSNSLRGQPDKPVRPEGIPAVIDYVRDVQPILDKHCVKCHGADKRDGKIDLSGDATERYTMSYRMMTHKRLFNDARNLPVSNYKPYSYGSVASPLLTKYTKKEHYDVKLSQHELDILRYWIETSATYTSTYAALYTCKTRVRLPFHEIMLRCRECHTQKYKPPRGPEHDIYVFPHNTGGHLHQAKTAMNLTQPEKSRILLAPLAKEAGGLGICKKDGKAIYANKQDPLYQKTLAAIQDGSNRHLDRKRWYMPGFQPNIHYVREMKRFGALPADYKEGDFVDFRAADKKYWDAFTVDKK